MKKLMVILAVAVVTSACSSISASQTSDFTFSASEFTSIILSNASGDIVLRGSPDETISIHVRKHGPENQLDGVLVNQQQVDERRVFDVEYLTSPSSVSVDYVIEAPSGLFVELKSASGNILLEDYSGVVNATTASGNIELHDVEGEIRAVSASGDVEVIYTQPLQAVADPVLIPEILEKWTYSSSVTGTGTRNVVSYPELAGEGQRIFRSSSGNVTLSLAADLKARLFIQVVSKRFRSDFDVTKVSEDGVLYTSRTDSGEGPLIILATASGYVNVKALPTQ